MNPKKNVTCTEVRGFTFGCMSGGSIKGYQANISKHYDIGHPLNKTGKYKILKSEVDGKLYNSIEELDKMGLERGYIHYYGRNTCEFVMSKAARKRGYTTQNRGYHFNREYYEKRINS